MYRVVINFILVYITVVKGGVRAPSTIQASLLPQHKHLRSNTELEGITCQFTAAVDKCELRVFNLTTPSPQLIGKHEHSGPALLGHVCLMTLSAGVLTEGHLFAIVCRGRTATSEWAYASMSLYKSTSQVMDMALTQTDMPVLGGHDVSIVITSPQELTRCQVRASGSVVDLFSSSGGKCNKRHCFYGKASPTRSRVCGVRISNATDGDNGILTFSLGRSYQQTVFMEETFVYVILAKEPTSVVLDYTVGGHESGGVTLTATCTVTGSRPAAILSWYLGEEPISDERVRSVAQEEWAWPFDEQMTTQTLTVTLADSDYGKVVKCKVSHQALREEWIEERKITKSTATNPASTIPTTTIPPTTTTKSPKPTSAPHQPRNTENDDRLRKLERIWFPVIMAFLIILLVLIIALALGFYLRNTSCRSSPKQEREGTVKYRRYLEPSQGHPGDVDKQVSPCQGHDPRSTVSSGGCSSVATGVEFAEIRASMVQRCVDKINASDVRPSSETGELSPRSIYLSYDERM